MWAQRATPEWTPTDSRATWSPAMPWRDALVALALAAPVTERAALGTAVLVLPLRNPVECAIPLRIVGRPAAATRSRSPARAREAGVDEVIVDVDWEAGDQRDVFERLSAVAAA
jgi:hypothetical protein